MKSYALVAAVAWLCLVGSAWAQPAFDADGCITYQVIGPGQAPPSGALVSTITVPDDYPLSNVEVQNLTLSHPRIGALKISLTHLGPASSGLMPTTALLKDVREGGVSSDMSGTSFADNGATAFPDPEAAPFTGTFVPDTSFADAFVTPMQVPAGAMAPVASSSAGTWTLRIVDLGVGSSNRTLSVAGWSLLLCAQSTNVTASTMNSTVTTSDTATIGSLVTALSGMLGDNPSALPPANATATISVNTTKDTSSPKGLLVTLLNRLDDPMNLTAAVQSASWPSLRNALFEPSNFTLITANRSTTLTTPSITTNNTDMEDSQIFRRLINRVDTLLNATAATVTNARSNITAVANALTAPRNVTVRTALPQGPVMGFMTALSKALTGSSTTPTTPLVTTTRSSEPATNTATSTVSVTPVPSTSLAQSAASFLEQANMGGLQRALNRTALGQGLLSYTPGEYINNASSLFAAAPMDGSGLATGLRDAYAERVAATRKSMSGGGKPNTPTIIQAQPNPLLAAYAQRAQSASGLVSSGANSLSSAATDAAGVQIDSLTTVINRINNKLTELSSSSGPLVDQQLASYKAALTYMATALANLKAQVAATPAVDLNASRQASLTKLQDAINTFLTGFNRLGLNA